ncbi:MAG TPA: transcription termination/antitermination NusG family protein [Gammaproteobacteria bacterium]|nr:transcription termination/antitermination NusG family protein [Gammaproteobacteria bacterium]
MPGNYADVHEPAATESLAIDREPQWHVLWAKSNCERSVQEQLAAKGYEVLLPTVQKWSRSSRVQRLRCAPLFPGYLFLRRAIDRRSYLDISRARGLVRILGAGWEHPACVPEREMEAICRLQHSELPRLPYTYLNEGERVRITRGPLVNATGIFLRTDSVKGLLILSVDLLSRSVAVRVNCSHVVPA